MTNFRITSFYTVKSSLSCKADEVIDETSTITENDGSYCLTLEPGIYTLVAEKDGYVSVPADFKIEIDVEAGNSYTDNNFVLELEEALPPGE